MDKRGLFEFFAFEMIELLDLSPEKEEVLFLKRLEKETLPIRIITIGVIIGANVALTALFNWLFRHQVNWGFISLALFALYFVCIIRIVEADKKGAKVLWGKPWKPVYSGPSLVLWPFEEIKKLTKARIEMNFAVGAVITKAGNYEVGGETRMAEPARIEIDAGLYGSFGDGKDIIQAAQHLPTDVLKNAENLTAIKEPLKNFLSQLAGSIVRETAAGKTWVEVNDERAKIAKEAQEKLQGEATFDQIGLAKDLEVVITNVALPPKLQDALTAVEVAEREKQAKIRAAEADKASEILTAEGKKQAGILAAEAFKVELENQMAGLGLKNPQAFADYLVSFEIAKGFDEGTKTVPILFGGAQNLLDLAKQIATSRGLSGPVDFKTLLSSEEGKGILKEVASEVLGKN